MTLASGPLYERLGAGGYWAMALLCAAAVPAALALGKADNGTPLEAEEPPGGRRRADLG